jgi:hypothetical protein
MIPLRASNAKRRSYGHEVSGRGSSRRRARGDSRRVPPDERPAGDQGDGAATTTWTSDELERIGAADELELAVRRSDGTLRPPVAIWVVRAPITALELVPTEH